MTKAFDSGRKAEAVAALFLQNKGCQIIAQNWRTRWCEIDVIAFRAQTVYLCEVKYRSRPYQGSGIEYITSRKLRQMRFAADVWVAAHGWNGDLQLCAIEISGSAFRVTQAVKIAI